MCIYNKYKSGLNYTSKEHVFPAGIGGVFTLSAGTVSDEFNNAISKLEQRFLRDSFIGIARQIEGPGKRGSLHPGKATKSTIHLLVDTANHNSFSIGYLMMGKTYEIPQVLLDTATGQLEFSFNKYENHDPKKELTQFASACDNFQNLQIKVLNDDRLPENLLLFGVAENIEENYNSFFVVNSLSETKLTEKLINAIGLSLANRDQESNSKTYLPQSALQAKFDTEYFRIYAKIAFNALAYLKGKEYILADLFDPVRDWIVKGGNNAYARLDNTPSPFLENNGKNPRNIHYVMFTVVENSLIAHVSFYGALKACIVLCEQFAEKIIDGIICDWINHRDLKFADFMRETETDSRSYSAT